MDLVVIGLSHQTAPVEVRERLAVIPGEIESHLQQLVRLPGVAEAVLVSTCNRVEIYAAAADARSALAALREHLHGGLAGQPHRGAPIPSWIATSTSGWGGRRSHHLFRVAASLDSLVVGEPQILGQIKDAFDLAMKARTAGRELLGSPFQAAFRAARKVRRDTAIARQPVSVSSVAVELARQVWSGFEGRRVLVVGAGKMSDLATRALRASGATVAVTNRTPARAEELAQRLGCSVEPFEDLRGGAGAHRTSSSPRPGRASRSWAWPCWSGCRRRGGAGHLVLIDIAVPRDVDPAVDGWRGSTAGTSTTCRRWCPRTWRTAGRRPTAPRRWSTRSWPAACRPARGNAVGPTITALRSRSLGVARAEAEKTLASLQGLDDRARRALSMMAESIVTKLLHAPQVALKKGGATDEGEALLRGRARAASICRPSRRWPRRPRARRTARSRAARRGPT